VGGLYLDLGVGLRLRLRVFIAMMFVRPQACWRGRSMSPVAGLIAGAALVCVAVRSTTRPIRCTSRILILIWSSPTTSWSAMGGFGLTSLVTAGSGHRRLRDGLLWNPRAAGEPLAGASPPLA